MTLAQRNGRRGWSLRCDRGDAQVHRDDDLDAAVGHLLTVLPDRVLAGPELNMTDQLIGIARGSSTNWRSRESIS